MQSRLGWTLRMLRKRRGWSQRELGALLSCSQQRMSRYERDVRRAPLGFVAAWTDALGGYLSIDVRIGGERAVNDARHARLQNELTRRLRAAGWLVQPERSFNHYGDRGRVDILAYHPVTRVLLVIEVKSQLLDVQDTLGRLDIKRRVAGALAAEHGWDPVTTVPALVIREDRTSRRRVQAHADLFAALELRARAARAWMSAPRGRPPSGILLFEPDPQR